MRSRNVNRTTSLVQELPPLGAGDTRREFASLLGYQSLFGRWRISRCIYREPAAVVGLLEEEAAAQGLEYIEVSDSIRLVSDLGRTTVDPKHIFLKVIVDARPRNLLSRLTVGDHDPAIVISPRLRSNQS
jgi:pyruvate/2-oxoglutarate dehydrogenase complex dihydrolipoamide dehydrogenase (E3) component